MDAPCKDHLFALHAHDADGGAGAPALLLKIHRVVFDIDLDLALIVESFINEQRIPCTELRHPFGDGAERLFKRASVILVIAFLRDEKGPVGLQHGTSPVLGDVNTAQTQNA